jgi:hypothetical protein
MPTDQTTADPTPSTPPPKRRFWQIHLSTAVVACMFAGWFMHMNMGEPTVVQEISHGTSHPPFLVIFPSWPKSNVWRSYAYTEADALKYMQEYSTNYVSVNIPIGVAMLMGLVAAMEYLIRRRSKP